MRFLNDTEIGSSFYPEGTVIRLIPSGDIGIIPPSLDSHKLLMTVALNRLIPVNAYRAVVFNYEVSVLTELEIYGTDQEEAKSLFIARVRSCEILSIESV